ncbi:MAG TPA: WG repeat-containing protein, partial [Nitrososphaeraceae archaeon]
MTFVNKNVMRNTLTTKINVLIFLTALLTSTSVLSQPYFPIRQNKLWGAIDSTGTLIIQPQYDRLHVTGENSNFIVAYKGDSTFLINSKLSIIARTTYANIIEIGEGIFQTTGKSNSYPWFYGLMDSNGKIVSQPKFCLVYQFNDKVTKADIYTDTTAPNFRDWKRKSGIINKEGNWVIPPTYEPKYIQPSSEGLINFYERDKGWGAMNIEGEIIITPKYSHLGPCKNGYMEYRQTRGRSGSGLMKKDETIVIPDDTQHMTSYYPRSPYDTLVVVHTLEVKNDFLGYGYFD